MIEPWLSGYRNYVSWCQNMFSLYCTLPDLYNAWVKVCVAMARTQTFSFAPPRPRPERRDISRRSYGM